MKLLMKPAVLALAAVALAGAPALAQTEGVAEMKMTSTGGEHGGLNGTGRTYVSKTGWRTEMEMILPAQAAKATGTPTAKMVMFGKISDPDKMFAVNDATKSYSVIDVKEARETAEKMRAEGKKEKKYAVKRLGKDSVAGFACESVEVTEIGGKQVIDACVAKDFLSGDWMKAMNRNRGADWTKALKDSGVDGYPVRITFTEQGSPAKTSIEIVKFEKRHVPPTLFEVPPGYKETSMMGVMAQTPEQAKQMEEGQKRMKEAMEKMTPEQRKQMEEMMKKMGQQKQ